MTTRIRTLVAAGLLAAALALPAAASAHGTGYAGFGCTGWSPVGINAWARDCYAGQNYSAGGHLYTLIFHDYQGIWAPSDYYSWEQYY